MATMSQTAVVNDVAMRPEVARIITNLQRRLTGSGKEPLGVVYPFWRKIADFYRTGIGLRSPLARLVFALERPPPALPYPQSAAVPFRACPIAAFPLPVPAPP